MSHWWSLGHIRNETNGYISCVLILTSNVCRMLLSNLPVYIFLDGLAISQKLKAPIQWHEHEVYLAR